jgi:hypothetical protein
MYIRMRDWETIYNIAEISMEEYGDSFFEYPLLICILNTGEIVKVAIEDILKIFPY